MVPRFSGSWNVFFYSPQIKESNKECHSADDVIRCFLVFLQQGDFFQ